MHRLGGLVTEALDEIFDLGNLFLLVLVSAQLTFTPFRAKLYVFVVLHTIVHHLSARNLQCAIRNVVDERAIVAHQDNGIRIAREELLQPADTLDVQMVGRLVEQQHIVTGQQKFGQLDAHAPSAGEFSCGALQIFAVEAQTGERSLDFCVIVLRTHHLQTVVFAAEGFDELHIFRRIVVGATGKFVVQSAHAVLELMNVGKSFFHFGSHRRIVAEHHHLREVSHTYIALHGHVPVGRLLNAG